MFDTEAETPATPVATFTSNPIAKYKVGPYRFDKATLHLYSKEDVEKFTKLVKALPAGERAKIQKVDLEAANEIAKQIIAQQGKVTQEIDSTIGERQTPPQKPIGSLNAIQLMQQAAEQKKVVGQ